MSENAKIKSAPNISAIWIIPLIALLIGAWMLYQYQANKGTTIFIKMPHAEGIVAGKTEIKVRSVKIGQINHVRLSDQQNSVIARAQIDKHYDDLLTDDAKIWVVKPRIDDTGITGMSTLLSGVYLEFAPGESKKLADKFELQDEPALIGNDVKGGRFTLLSYNAEVLDVSTGIYFKDYKIGQIETATFDWKNQAMKYGIFINEPYQNLITLNSIFWVNSGIEIDLSADGINVNTGSLSKLLKGGISVGIPEQQSPGEVATNGHSFSLSNSYKAALEERFYDFDYYLIDFEQSIRGLRAGAPVEYRGMRIGSVVEAPASVMIDGKPAHFRTDNTAVPALIKIEYGRLYHDSTAAREFWHSSLDSWIKNGLRASLKPGNLLTGAVYVDLDIYDNAEPAELKTIADYTVFPSVSSGITVIADQVSDVLNKVNNLKIEDSLAQMQTTFSEYQELAHDMRELINKQDTQDLPGDINRNFAEMTKSMQQFDKTMKQFEKTMASYEQGSAFHQQLQTTLSEFKRLSEELQPLTRGLNQQPNMLIFDKELPADPTPRKQ
ncbi:intermembrane transport protein PqiB [Pseudoalteromonas sp. ACER1]|jgi:paraquat-inducible protein B|uniref:Mammalian cell entry protein n=1 Tax=Pseudoalteromonas lipolytica TaxID=570156 RepID=A0A0N8HKQ6_9GAMM|nr:MULTISPECIES: intermembrane transport protein PqiB [Pseudoalteromonas]KPM84544.1 mammalian cell entry protein [Pseudoalteromonas lipolytica]MCF2848411.1 intermembrane transport protein PqiB [Pseudoalteromonas sp. PAST1]MCF2916379.1 intermembrane transport protein PqiB [Pseudoalteromonas sp. Cn5-37]MCH2088631.1 intermembrane transport protein PqiB [Pseudoalteromonas sp.]MCO7211897.1 intermembrane transport protein PqiB [Pseudoalteromonas sp. ACER1]|tara:strand:- start:351 stop:2006 length:1656 start_codon:yes stop_codon:yes gene_type:complete